MNKIRIRLSIVFIIIFIVIIILTIVRARALDSQDSIKMAINISDIPPSEDYIIAKMTWVTGFDWELADEDHNLSKYKGIYCNIKGPTPNDLILRYDFQISGNTYVFYVEERREFFDEEMNEPSLEYIVSGWDILYPVKHGVGDLLRTSWHITSKDIYDESGNRSAARSKG